MKNPHLTVGKLNCFLLLKNRRYGNGLVVEWYGKNGFKIWTLPTNLFEVDAK